MYESTYGTDWERLDRQESVRRAFALGVAFDLGEDIPHELQRILNTAPVTYDRTLIELAFDEGRQLASIASSRNENPQQIWETLVVRSGVGPRSPPTHHRSSLPPALRILTANRPPTSELEQIKLPGFLLSR